MLHEFEHPADVNGVVFSNDNKTLLTGCGDAAIRVFDVASSNEIRKLDAKKTADVTPHKRQHLAKKLDAAPLPEKTQVGAADPE